MKYSDWYRTYLVDLIRLTHGSLTEMKRVSGLGRATLYRHILDFGLSEQVNQARGARPVTSGTEKRRKRAKDRRKALDLGLPTGASKVSP